MNTDDLVTIASPLPYLFAEEKHSDRQAREALFLTFNADLGFFERTILGVTQATGARITVVGDGRMSAPDPRAARNAGTRYLHGLAVTPSGSAFHPKVSVVAGPERALVAIGSGNLSMGGWHLNKETWTVATADRHRCPAIIPQLAEWLRSLPAACTITPGAIASIQRTATTLEQLADASSVVETGHRLVHSAEQPILSQLPRDPISQLLLYAPFHDERAEGIRGLIKELTPDEVTLAVQSGGRTVIQPTVVRKVVDALDVEFQVIEDTSAAYRHGKLIEGVSRDGTRWTLTGSPNLSESALLRAAADGGNIEIGVVVSSPTVSMFPEGKPRALDAVPPRRIDGKPPAAVASAVLLISAERSEAGLRVVFAKPLGHLVRILVSNQTKFDIWNAAGTVPAGVADYELPELDVPAGSRACAEWDDAAGPARGAVIFVCDPMLVMRRLGENQNRTRTAPLDPVKLISDPRLLQMWSDSLAELVSTRSAVRLPGVAGSGAPRGESGSERHGAGLRTDSDEDNWLAYLDDANDLLGSSIVRFTLRGFPALRGWSPVADAEIEEPADQVIDESNPGFDTDDTDTVSGHPATPGETGAPADDGSPASDTQTPDSDPVIPDKSDLPESEKRRVRRVLTRLVGKNTAKLPAIGCLAVVQLLLCIIEARIWDAAVGEEGWFPLLGAGLLHVAEADIPEPLEKQAASLSALAMYLMHEYRPTSARTTEVLLYDEVAKKTAYLYSGVDASLLADYAGPFSNANGYPVDPDAAMHVVSMIVQGDPLIEAIDVLEARHPSWQVDKAAEAQLLIRGDFRSPFIAAAEGLDIIHGLDPAAVRAWADSGDWAIAARQSDDLIRVESRNGNLTWRHYRLSSLISPSGIARDQELANRVRVSHGAFSNNFSEARQILAATKVDLNDETAG